MEVLKENRKTLKVNPAAKDFFDLLEAEFEKSLGRLSFLKNKIATTDRFIDLTVYRLCGLTEKEVNVIEET